jgi:hypothetical protein
MRIERLTDESRGFRTSVLAQAKVTGAIEFPSLLELVRSERISYPDAAVFVTLDDLGQALYTSMHATESTELEIEVDDLDFERDPVAVRRGTLRQVAHTARMLAVAELRRRWSDLADTRECPPEWIATIAAVNANPASIVDDEVHVLNVPVADALMAIAGLPNGYFSDDWDTFDNFAVTSHLAATYHYRPLGIGASWIGFERDAPLSLTQARQLVGELTPIYGNPDAPGWFALIDALTSQPTLLLGYTDDFGE